MDWRDSDGSDEEHAPDAQATANRKRSSRACDQCRKTKSKCEKGPGDGSQCKSCAQANTACTFLGPSYKRGPPKGYIHAIEQRWHQVEALLGAIMQANDPRVTGIVSELRHDALARDILERVESGPYGASGRTKRTGGTKEDFFASVLRSNEQSPSPSRDPSRSRRQSRISREKVSSALDRGLSVVPTPEWQDGLAARLAGSPSGSSGAPSPSQLYGLPSSSSSTLDGEPLQQKRRLNTTPSDPDWNNMYTMDPATDDEEQNVTEHLGSLSLDENQEIRYHGRISGLQLLSRQNRTDDRNDGGVWRLPMARVWPPSKDYIYHVMQEDDVDVQLPPTSVQDRLIELYFVYIHPVFPVLNKQRFLSDYRAWRQGERVFSRDSPREGTPKPEPSQRLSALLLLSMFSITARFSDMDQPQPAPGKMWEAGQEYQEGARTLLTKIFHRSRPSTVQALLLLGYREFGIGGMEQGWIYIGMAIRMAIDLGMNRNSDNWKIHGAEMFDEEETQTRRQIWWVCILSDRYGSIYMGRPVVIRDEDFDNPIPSVIPSEEQQPWRPLSSEPTAATYVPSPNVVMSNFRATCTLFVILGAIITKVYPVRFPPGVHRRALLASFESQLDQWYISLPQHLRYDPSNKRKVPPPHVLFLHVRYWGSVLLLNRAFIPNWKGVEITSKHSTQDLKAFDLAQSAASHIAGIVTTYREAFTLKRSSPFITSYILSAGIMHILTLTLRPSNVQASLGLRQCLTALKEMEIIWPSAARAWDLLSGVQLQAASPDGASNHSSPGGTKRQAEVAFGSASEKSSDYLQREAFGGMMAGGSGGAVAAATAPSQAPEPGVHDLSTRIMAHMLGLDIPGIEPSTSFYPGYEWWPRNGQAQGGPPSMGPSGSLDATTLPPPLSMNGMGAYGNQADEWSQHLGAADVGMQQQQRQQQQQQQQQQYPYSFDQFGL